MSNLTAAQKIYLGVLLVTAGAWLGLELGVPIYEYGHGKSAFTALLAQIASILKFAVFGVLALAWVLQSIGILPAARPGPEFERVSQRAQSPISPLRNLAIWIVIALVLVFFFNVFQGGGGGGNQAQNPTPQTQTLDLMSILINWFPMLLIFGVWIFFFRQMKVGQGKGRDRSNES